MPRPLLPTVTLSIISIIVIVGIAWMILGNNSMWNSTSYAAGVNYAHQLAPSPMFQNSADLVLACRGIAANYTSPESFVGGCYAALTGKLQWPGW